MQAGAVSPCSLGSRSARAVGFGHDRPCVAVVEDATPVAEQREIVSTVVKVVQLRESVEDDGRSLNVRRRQDRRTLVTVACAVQVDDDLDVLISVVDG